MPDHHLEDLAAAVLDREAVDWTNVHAHVRGARDREAADALKRLSEIVGRRDPDPFSPLRRRLPGWIVGVRWLALVLALAGLAGTALALLQLDLSRPAVALVPFIFAVLLAFSVGAALLDASARDRRARALAFCYWTIAAAFGAGGVTWLRTAGIAGFGLLDGLRPEVFFGAGLWFFAREFPRTSRYSRLDTLCRSGFWLAALSGWGLFLANAAFALNGGPPLGLPASLQRHATPGGWFWTLHFAMALPALAAMALRARTAPAGEVARVRLFLAALALAIVPVAALVILGGLFPDLGRRLSQEWRLASAWVVYPPILSLPFATMYAVAATNVLPVRLVIGSGVRYVVGGRILLGAVFVPVLWLLVHLYDNRHRVLTDVFSDDLTIRLAWLLAIAALLLAGRRGIVTLLDRLDGAGLANPSQVFARMAGTLKDARTPLEVATLLAAGAEQAFQASAERYLIRVGRLAPVGDGLALPEGSLIPALLQGAAEPCLIGEGLPRSLFRFLSWDDQMWVARSGTAAVIPLMMQRGGGELLGMVALRHRRNALSFGQDDLQFLKTGAASAALACDALRAARAGDDDTPEEVALECSVCGLVVEWRDTPGRCACAGALRPGALPKQLAGRFEISRRLGAGGMGVVYLAADRTLGRDVAVKTLTWLSQPAAERSLNEARAMAGLSHPNVAVLYGSESWQSTPVLVMEYLAGGTLDRRLRGGAIRTGAAVRIAVSVASALEYVHATGRCHGDVKPSNIGFNTDNVPKLLDFGLSQALAAVAFRGEDEPSSRPALPAWGTPAYLSPEAWAGSPPDEGLDVWALSVVLCEMVAGRHPYGAARSAHDMARRSAETIAALRPHVPNPLCDLLDEALCHKGHGRPRSAAELRRRLDVVSAHVH